MQLLYTEYKKKSKKF